MPKFVPGLKLSELFYKEVVKDILKIDFPELKYSAGLIGAGSEVLGFDTHRSTDHDWGPRMLIFLKDEDYKKKDVIAKALAQKLPLTFKGFSTNFGSNEGKVKWLAKAKKGELINHRIEIFTIKSFFEGYLGIDPTKKIDDVDWLTLSEHKLRASTSGKIFRDDLGLEKIRKYLAYYPRDIWLYLLAAEWQKIGQEEHLAGRCGDLGDELGSRIIATRLVHSMASLCFLMEKQYAPYSKWFGTAFLKLKCGRKLSPIFNKLLSAEKWKNREISLSLAYGEIAKMHNNLKLTKPLSTKTELFFDRPYKVIYAGRFSEELKKLIKNKAIKEIKPLIGSVNQFSDSVDLLENNELLKKCKVLFCP